MEPNESSFRALFQRTRDRLFNYAVIQAQARKIAFEACERARTVEEERSSAGSKVMEAFSRRWLGTVAYWEALRLVFQDDRVQGFVRQLTPEEQQLLSWYYVDQLTMRQFAMILCGDSPSPGLETDARERVHRAYQRLVQVLAQNGWGNGDWTFPR